QTVVIWRALRRIGVPTLLFLNKVDRSGADVDRALTQVRRRLTPHVVVLSAASGLGHADARVEPLAYDDGRVVEAVAELSETVLAAWLAGQPVASDEVHRAVRDGVRRDVLTPVLCGSAITGAGVPELSRALVDVLPRAVEADGPLAGTVFAVD